jgi:hypothetical protein
MHAAAHPAQRVANRFDMTFLLFPSRDEQPDYNLLDFPAIEAIDPPGEEATCRSRP